MHFADDSRLHIHIFNRTGNVILSSINLFLNVNFTFLYSYPIHFFIVVLSVLEGQEKGQVQHDFREEDKDESKEVEER